MRLFGAFAWFSLPVALYRPFVSSRGERRKWTTLERCVANGRLSRAHANLPGSGTGCGTVFSLTPAAASGAAWTETVLYSFIGYPLAGIPYANPLAGVVVGTSKVSRS